MIGFGYIGIFGLNTLVHIVILIGSSCHQAYKLCRKRYLLFKRKKCIQEKLKEKELLRIINAALPEIDPNIA